MKKTFLLGAALFAAIFSQAQWEPDVRLTNDPAGSLTTWANSVHAIATSGDTVHVVWYDNRDGNFEIYYKRSVDSGLTWGADTRLTNDPAVSAKPSITVSGSLVHVAWYDNRDSDQEIYYKRSIDGGNSWGPDTRISYHVGYSWHPTIAISSEGLLLAWYEYTSPLYDIFYKRSTDNGSNWGLESQLTNHGKAAWESIFANGPVIHVAWYDQRDGNREIYYKRSTDGGITWGADTRLTNDPATSWLPCISVSDSVVHVGWADNRDGGYWIYYKRSIDGGITWGADTKLSSSSGDIQGPSLAVSGSAVHMVWNDDRDGNLEIYYKKSDDAGLSWEMDTRLTNAAGDSEYPSVSISGPMVHVVWTDLRDGNEEIYYKRNPTGGFPVGIENDKINNSAQQIIIYPNPASTHIHIKFNNEVNQPAGNKDEKNILSIRNIIGVELLSKQIKTGESDVDVSNLQNGLYFVGISKSNNQSLNTKLIIQK